MPIDKWFIISSEKGQHRVSELMQELNISTTLDPMLYIRLGYKVLSAQDKETFYVLKHLSDANMRKTGQPVCFPSLDYLATALGTNESSQRYRIKQLKKYKLIDVLPNNSFLILAPIKPDSTFLSTIVALLRRRHLNELVQRYKTSNNPMQRMDLLIKMKNFKYLGSEHSYLEDIININA